MREADAEIAIVDLDRPETLPDDLLDGVGAVYFVTWNGPTAYDHSRALLDAITRSGTAPHVVRLSAFGDPRSRIISELERCEADLEASDLPWTILRPTFFMQNTLMAAPTIKEQGVIYYDWGSGKVGMVDVRDIVDSAVGALTGDAGSVVGETFVLTGPAAIGFAEVAEVLSDVTGREIEYVPVPHDAALEAMIGMGFPEWIAQGYAELNVGFENGYADRTTDHVQKLSGHEPRDFEQFARDFADAFAGDPAAQTTKR